MVVVPCIHHDPSLSYAPPQTTQAFTDVITDGVTKRWWSGFDVIRRLMYIVMVTVTDFADPIYTQVEPVNRLHCSQPVYIGH